MSMDDNDNDKKSNTTTTNTDIELVIAVESKSESESESESSSIPVQQEIEDIHQHRTRDPILLYSTVGFTVFCISTLIFAWVYAAGAARCEILHECSSDSITVVYVFLWISVCLMILAAIVLVYRADRIQRELNNVTLNARLLTTPTPRK